MPRCGGINHADFSIDGRFAIFTCEFTGTVAKIDLVNRKVVGYIQLIKPGLPTQVVKGIDGRDEVICTTWKGMPQDVRVSPDGKTFFVADMMSDGVHVVDGESFRQTGFIPTGVGAHGLYPSRDGKKLYVANRGSNKIHGLPHGKGGVSVIDFATSKVEVTWPIPGGGSPDMGNVSADGKTLWLSGRYDNVVYAIDTGTRRREEDPRRQGAARARGVAATGPLFARAYRQHALKRGASHEDLVDVARVSCPRWACRLGAGALAEDTLKLAIGQRGNWENAAPELGQKAGIFRKHGLNLEILYTQGAGETLQAVISGSVDIGIGVGTAGVLGAFAKGAPVRAIANSTTGADDLFWYVPDASPIKSIKDAAGKTIAYSTNGSSTNLAVLAFIREFGVAMKPVATGSPASTFTQTMTGQVDIGWSSPPFGVEACSRAASGSSRASPTCRHFATRPCA